MASLRHSSATEIARFEDNLSNLRDSKGWVFAIFDSNGFLLDENSVASTNELLVGFAAFLKKQWPTALLHQKFKQGTVAVFLAGFQGDQPDLNRMEKQIAFALARLVNPDLKQNKRQHPDSNGCVSGMLVSDEATQTSLRERFCDFVGLQRKRETNRIEPTKGRPATITNGECTQGLIQDPLTPTIVARSDRSTESIPGRRRAKREPGNLQDQPDHETLSALAKDADTTGPMLFQEQNKLLQEQNKLLQKQNKLLEEQLQLERQKLERLLGKSNISDLFAELTPEQEAVFQKLEAIPENDEAARKLAEQELAHLEGTRATKTLVDRLKNLLKNKQWGILATGNVVTAPLWHNHLLRLARYNEKARRELVSSFKTVPRLHLAERIDRRTTR